MSLVTSFEKQFQPFKSQEDNIILSELTDNFLDLKLVPNFEENFFLTTMQEIPFMPSYVVIVIAESLICLTIN